MRMLVSGVLSSWVKLLIKLLCIRYSCKVFWLNTKMMKMPSSASGKPMPITKEGTRKRTVLWIMAEAEFLGIVLVLVYVGAVMVLLLFVVMMLDIRVEEVKQSLHRYWALAAAVPAAYPWF